MTAFSVSYPADNNLAPRYAFWDSDWDSTFMGTWANGFRDFRLHLEYPRLNFLYTTYETGWESGGFCAKLARNYWWLSFFAAALYVLIVFGGQRIMRDRKPFDLRGWLAAWNLVLAVFSVAGSLRLIAHLGYGLMLNHHSYFFCRAAAPAYGKLGPAGLWAHLFIWSKYAELIDTLFLILRKKPVSFLHWFHHATVMIYCWHASQYQMPTGIFFAAMNYVVHSVMYFYYFLAAITKPPRWGKMVTVMQIAQMFGGMFITGYHYYLLQAVPNCDGSYENLTAAFVMYTAYMCLFVQFFVERYLKRQATAVENNRSRVSRSIPRSKKE
jgi:hypothetical protein